MKHLSIVLRTLSSALCLFFTVICVAKPLATNVTIYPSASGRYFYAQWYGIEPGRNYALQFSADAVHWSFLQIVTNTCSTNAAWVQNTAVGAHAKCFFRIQEAAP